MMGYWMCFAFLTAILLIPSMQGVDISYDFDYGTGQLMSSMRQEEEEPVYRPASWSIDNRNGNCGQCGISPVCSPNIVNGEAVEPPNRFPWMVSLFVNGGKTCGASIISERFVMTASHCIKRKNITRRLDRNTCVLQNGRQVPCYYNANEVKIAFLTNSYMMTAGRTVAEIIPHPHYQPDKSSVQNDIALIRMFNTIQCGDYAMPICLPSPTVPVEIGMPVLVAGWGATMDPRGRGKEQRATTIEVTDCSECEMAAGFTTRSSICLSGMGRSSPCFGDSGGPAFIQKHNKFFAIGVASAHTSDTCKPSNPVIYTSVSNYMGWIKEVSGVDCQN